MSVSSSTTTAAIAAAPLSAGELLLDVLPVAFAAGYALDLAHTLQLCGTTWRRGAARADGSLDREGFVGGTNDTMASALHHQAPWLAEAKAAGPASSPHAHTRAPSTHLIAAVDRRDVRRVRELIAAGAPLDSRDHGGMTALHHAVDLSDHPPTEESLEYTAWDEEERDEPPAEEEEREEEEEDRAMVSAEAREARKARAARIAARVTKLRAAAAADSAAKLAIVEALLAGKFEGAGASVNAADDAGVTPLMQATYLFSRGFSASGRQVLAALLDCGADIALQDAEGKTALERAVYEHFVDECGCGRGSYDSDNVACLELLHQRGGALAFELALCARSATDGSTVLHTLGRSGRSDIAACLHALAPSALEAASTVRNNKGRLPSLDEDMWARRVHQFRGSFVGYRKPQRKGCAVSEDEEVAIVDDNVVNEVFRTSEADFVASLVKYSGVAQAIIDKLAAAGLGFDSVGILRAEREFEVSAGSAFPLAVASADEAPLYNPDRHRNRRAWKYPETRAAARSLRRREHAKPRHRRAAGGAARRGFAEA